MLEQQPEQQLEEDLTHIAALAEEEVVLVERGKPASESRCGPSKALAGVVGERLVSRGGGARAVWVRHGLCRANVDEYGHALARLQRYRLVTDISRLTISRRGILTAPPSLIRVSWTG